MRIFLLNNLFPPLGIGGSEMSVYYLAKGLLSLGNEVYVISLNSTEETIEENIEGIFSIRLGCKKGFGPNIYNKPRLELLVDRQASVEDAKISEKLKPYLRDLSPDIVHTNVVGDLHGIWKAAKTSGCYVIHTLRSYSPLCSRRMLVSGNPCARQCSVCLTPLRVKSRDQSSIIDGVVGISRHIMGVYNDAGWFADVRSRRIIGNSFEVKDVEKTGEHSDRASLYDFGFIGRLHESKGIEYLLHSLELTRKVTELPIKILVAGTGNPEYVGFLKRRFSHPDNHFSGYIDAHDFFRRIRICVVPSLWYEPFGRIFIEAMHNGIPVMASIRGGGGELVDGSCGWTFDPANNDLQSLLGSALSCSRNDYESKSKVQLDKSKDYSIMAIAMKYMEFYKHIFEK